MLLKAPMEIADMRDHVDNDLPVDNELQSQHAMGRRMLRSHVHDHLVCSERSVKSGNGEGSLRYGFHQYGTFMPR
jgi:hypothetical protein